MEVLQIEEYNMQADVLSSNKTIIIIKNLTLS